MSGLFALLGTMQDALSAQQAGLDVTGENITNVNTPGYVERTPVLESDPGGSGGVDVASIQREYNSFTFGQVLVAQGGQSSSSALSTALDEAQSVVAPQGGTAISDSMNAFFSSLQTLTASPSDPSARSAVLAQATQLAQSFSTTSTGLGQLQSSLLSQAQGVGVKVNQDLTQIAQLNAQIAQTQATGGDSSDLCDERDAAVQDVATQIGARVVSDASGSITLFAGGTVLVSGNQASQISVSQGTSGGIQVAAGPPNGVPTDITSGVTDGTLGGILQGGVQIAQTSASLDQLAYALSNQVNSVQESGYGLDGVTGRPLFTPPTQVAGAAMAMAVDPSVAGQPNNIGAAASATDIPGGNDVAVELAQLASQPLGSGGTATQQFAGIASQLGSAASAADADSSTRADMLTQAQNLNSSASGVSLSEEMVNLTRFQQAFEAATRVLQTADSLLGDFMTTMQSTS
jgi:flagellar hook-associated protein 1